MKHRLTLGAAVMSAGLGALMAVSALSPALAEAAGRIAVAGQGEVFAEPDMATVRLGVTQRAESAAGAMGDVSTAVDALLSRLEARGVAARDIQTSDLSLHPIYERRDGPAQQSPAIIGYQAANRLTVRVRDLPQLGALLGEMLDDGANEFQGVTFGIAEPGGLIDEARRAAVADARARAELYAEAAGVSLGALLELAEGGVAAPQPVMREMAAMRADSMPIAEGELSLSAEVSMVFAIGEDEPAGE
ncbi:SIMPL domain-containing protein [Poseidonocella sedimentorum]|uniref:26 kDa periplasmic immunogenic protein n=1 Tax=Poseidonocella sedimentorum TaxID=871652 RepID=A0A1I6CWG4_9RHOB|nr:SIMPL domain-containing protein [Poseidonocella sedimentorum]SFQ97528.1 hypothetical protein SAMN04515673_101489 [Poseidonocella sedimentorum]